MTTVRYDKELEEFRNLMKVPQTFEEGFSFASLIGAIFVAMVMVPGAMYMTLQAGVGVGPAAQWVTVILFLELARRAHKYLKRAELFVLFYMAGAAMVQPFQGMIWQQFFVQSQSAIGMGVAEHLPSWYAPSDPDVLATRSFFNPAWYPAIGMVLFSTIMGRLNGTILTYGLFRVASDIEKLPFPMAPIGASGIMALAEQQEEEGPGGTEKPESWRWRIFSIGGILGLSFGGLYLGLPAISSAILGQPITLLPIPFVELSDKTADYLPAVATGINLNMGLLVTGMAMPFYAILGSFIGLVITIIVNPILYKHQILSSWTPGDSTPATLFTNNMDYYFSFHIGVSVAIAIAGIWQVVHQMRAKAALRKQQQAMRIQVEAESYTPPGRGDIPALFIIGTYVFTSMCYILFSGWLINWNRGVMNVLMFFAFIYTPILSYVTARLEGLAGQVVTIPMVREASFILSGYRGGVTIWCLPTPMHDYGRGVVQYRQAELTGTRFWSVWKAELILVPVVLVASIFFAQFIWSLGPIPGPEFPYTEVMWEQEAATRCIMWSSTLGRFSTFEEAFNWKYLAMGGGFGTALFAIMWPLHLPILLIYGIIRGLNQTLPHQVLPEIVGALVGRYYFQRKLGTKWRPYILVAAAGFHCGMGLITVFSVGLNFLAKSVIKIPF
ncbi:MAG: peptide transporter [Phycisphaerae bacterium]